MTVIRTAVVGASGYSGAELVGLLGAHPEVSVEVVMGARSAGRRWEELFPARAHLFRGEIASWEPDRLVGLDAVFLALPHGESAPAAAALLGRVGNVIDLSGDLRLSDPETYRSGYRREHPVPELLGRAVYGLPELFGDDLPGAGLVACPGCYPTAALLAAAPAMRLEGAGPAITVSAMSGTSGAGRSGDVALSFSEMYGDARAYRVAAHQHVPEMVAGLERYAGRPVRLTFVPHLIPIERGILATVVMPLDGPTSQAEVLAHYRDTYAGAPFVRVVDSADRLPAIRNVVGTNVCELAPVVDIVAGTLVVVAVIDNLLKGAAGQAVQVLNRVWGLAETTGLPGGEVLS
jgi:N-acetyl-gamma-glutamyl-phosphate reductase